MGCTTNIESDDGRSRISGDDSVAAKAPDLYRTLGPSEVRVLGILPGSGSDPIVLRLETVSLTPAPPPHLVALSYAWGDPTQGEEVVLLGNRSIPVTTNLFAALHQIREFLASDNHQLDNDAAKRVFDLGFAEFRLWADALCINQADSEEKVHQIPMMGAIYSSALAVIAYMEHVGLESDELLEVIRVGRLLRSYQRSLPGGDTRAELTSRLMEIQGVSGTMRLASHFTKLLSTKWLSRRWTIQEFALATEDPVVVIQDRVCSLWDLYDTLVALNNSPCIRQDFVEYHTMHYSMQAFESKLGIRLYGRRRHNVPGPSHEEESSTRLDIFLKDLNFALSACDAIFESTLPHDSIYAMLGMCQPTDLPTSLEPNYEQPYAEACHCYSAGIVKATGEAYLIGTCHRGFQDEPNIPTWVPDFNTMNKSLWNPLITPATPLQISDCKKKLYVDGLNMGRIRAAWKAADNCEDTPLRGLCNNARSFMSSFLQPSAPGSNWKDIMLCQLAYFRLSQALSVDVCNFLEMLQTLDFNTGKEQAEADPKVVLMAVAGFSEDKISELLWSLEEIWKFSWYLGTSGAAGTFTPRVGKDIEVGDVEVAIPGTLYPWCLRPAGTEGEYWFLGNLDAGNIAIQEQNSRINGRFFEGKVLEHLTIV